MHVHVSTVPANSPSEANSQRPSDLQSSNFAGYLVVLIPILVLFSILGYKRYKVNHRRRQIEKLEKLWKIDINKKTY